MVPSLKKIFKVILWLVISIVLLAITILILIRIPAIQNKLTDYVISSISAKTHTKVELNNINISFPKSVLIKGLYLEDKEKDTLFYAAGARINLNIIGLFRKKININSFALENADLNINREVSDSLFNFNFLLTAFSDTSGQADNQPGKPSKWTFSLDKVILTNISLRYDDEYGGMNAAVYLKLFKLKMNYIDLARSVYSIDDVRIEGLTADVLMEETVKSIFTSISQLKLTDAEIDIQNDLKVKIRKIDLDDTSLAYKTPGIPEKLNTFDAANLKYDHINLSASDLSYSNGRVEASIKKFTALDQNNFSIKEFETLLSMDSHSLSAKTLKLKTEGSYIDADINIQYPSLEFLKDSIQYIMLNIDLRNVEIKTSDVNYFMPHLSEPAFFREGTNMTSISGSFSGALNNLHGEDLIIATGANTILKTDFRIEGLPDYENAYFYFPDLTLSSGRKDIGMIAGPLLPESMELPAMIDTHISFEGQIKAFKSKIDLSSSFGSANLSAEIGSDESFSSKIKITDFDLGRLLKNQEMYGPVSLTAAINGQGLDKKSIKAKIKADASQIFLNNYNYHKLNIDGTITGQKFEGKINLDDENAVFDFEGLVNLNPNQEQYEFRLTVPGMDLKKLNFTKDDIQISLTALANLKGGKVQDINGEAGITNITLVHEGEKYILDSLLFASINEADTSTVSITSSIIGIKYSGTFSPAHFPAVLSQFVNNYFPFSDTLTSPMNKGLSAFNFEIQLHNHPIISEVLLPQLKEFVPGLIQGSFDEVKNELKLNASMKKLVYGSTEINDLEININSDANALNYSIASPNISNAEMRLNDILLEGKLADEIITANLSSNDEKQYHEFLIRSEIKKHEDHYRITIDPADFFLLNKRWNLEADHYIEIGKQGFLIHNLFMKNAVTEINIASVNDQFNDDLNISLRNFRLDDISRMIVKDTSLVKGNVDGNVLLKRTGNTYGLIADATITDLILGGVPVGVLTLKTGMPVEGKIEIDGNLAGKDNNLTAKGYFIPAGGDNSISINIAIESLSMKTVEAFSMGNLAEASGTLSGNFTVQGKPDAPEIKGALDFNKVFLKPSFSNSRLELRNENIQFRESGIFLNSFTLRDIDQHTAIIDGTVGMEQFKNIFFDLKVKTQDFLLFNTTAKDNKEFFGRMIIDSKMDITGPLTLPVINGRLKVKKGSNFTFAVPEDRLTTDKGEGVIEFVNSTVINPIMLRSMKKEAQKKTFKGLDIASIIEIDKQATLKLLIDPASTDSLVVKGDAALSFTLDRSGKVSLTGAYNLNEGSYLVTLESVIKKKFDIIPGSTIIWDGDPLDAEISIDASYSVRASPYDLVAGQMSGLSDVDKGGYKNRYPFLILLTLRGAILQPQIGFEIQLAPEDKGILNGIVNQKLNLLNEDESALNKQVFSLLVLGRFIQENPLQTESGGTSALVRSTVGKILSAQLNQLSSNMIPGIGLNFDIQSYNDYQTGQAEGRTELEIGLKKQLFNERLSIQLGGTLDVEGEKAKHNTTSDITSDVTVEYKLTKDGRYRLKAFRHNQYEGVIEGQLVETGAGVLYLRDFNKWKELFIRPKKIEPLLKTK